MSTKLNFKGRHVHGLAFLSGILNPRTGKIGYRLSYSYFLFRVEYEGIHMGLSGVNVDGDLRTTFILSLQFPVGFFFFFYPNWIMKFPIMAY